MKREWHSYEFSYGLDSNATEIRVSAPSFTCDECDLHFSTPEGEELKHEAVCTYLGVLSPREIRSIREFNGLSREQFARITGLGKGSLARWERGGNFQNESIDRFLRMIQTTAGMTLLRQIDREKQSDGHAQLTSGDHETQPKFRAIVSNGQLHDHWNAFKLASWVV